MTNVSVVTFDVADGSFTFYSKESWESQVQSWRDELFESGMIEDRDIIDEMDYYEVVECMWGEEVFVDYIPEDVK